MAKKKKKPLTKVEAARKRDGRLILIILATILVPIAMMLLGVGPPGAAFNGS